MATICGKQEFVRDYSEAIKNASAALFIGSGLSRDANAYDWKGLLKEAAEDIGLDVENEARDLISLAQYYVNSKGRQKINTAISKCFKDILTPSENHLLLASLPIVSYWTTNYDRLIEKAFEHFNISTLVLTDDDSLKLFTDGKDVVIRKLHGDVARPQDCVITKKDYEEFAYKHEILLAQLKGEMCAKTFLFLGYSFSDTDINHILTRIRLFYKGEPPQRHFCIMKRIERTDTYGTKKQEHLIDDLKTYGIHTVLIDDYSEITDMLKEIRHRIYSKNVYISGAYEDSNPDAEEYAKYAHAISKWLIENGYKIFTGYGKNLGAEIVAGGFEGCTRINDNGSAKRFNDSVFLFPFPFRSDLPVEERKRLYTEQRKNSILRTHVTIIINGTNNKTSDGSLQNAQGCLEESNISLEQGNIVIPIAKSGGAAKQIWDEMYSEGCEYTSSDAFKALNNSIAFDDVLDAVKLIITKDTQGNQ